MRNKVAGRGVGAAEQSLNAEADVRARGQSAQNLPRSRKDLAQQTISRRLRERREASGLSLRALARRVGVTASLLSQIETGRVNPSVATLYGLADALSTSVADFFSSDDATVGRGTPRAPALPVVHRQSRSHIELDHGIVWQSLLPVEEPGLEWMVVHYPSGAVSAPNMQHHGGRDYGLVLSGRLTIKLGFTKYVLGPGDSIAYDATTPHQVSNDADVPVEAVWLVLDRHAVS